MVSVLAVVSLGSFGLIKASAQSGADKAQQATTAYIEKENTALRAENQHLRALLGLQNTAPSNSQVIATAKPVTPVVQGTEGQKKTAYWLTTSSGVRHNSSCRFFKTSPGHAVGHTDGKPCKICGG